MGKKEILITKEENTLKIEKIRDHILNKNVIYRIDEQNPHFFRDEDSIYEVLENGTYKLVIDLYTGKGEVLILEGTSIIGASAFEKHNNVKEVKFPESLRVIESKAFAGSGLTSITIPDYIVSICSQTFSHCTELKSITLSPDLETIAPDAFEGCNQLKIKSPDYCFNHGIINKINRDIPSTLHNKWMKNQLFIYIGLDQKEEKLLEDTVVANGGNAICGNSYDSNYIYQTDYLVYKDMNDYNHPVYKRAQETSNHRPQIITFTKWKEMAGISTELNTPELQESIEDPYLHEKFDQFVKKISGIINKKGKEESYIEYDEVNRILSITLPFNQKTKNKLLLEERIESAEELQIGDLVDIQFNETAWKVNTKEGKSLGTLSNRLAEKSIAYINYITIIESSISSITPLSKRPNAKYATGTIKLVMKERIAHILSKQDLITRKQFAYIIQDQEAILLHWIGDSSIQKVTIPNLIEGKAVTTLPSKLFTSIPSVGINPASIKEITISEGIERIEEQSLYGIAGIGRIIFPSTVHSISPYVFSYYDESKNKYIEDHLARTTIYAAPIESYASRFLVSYRPDNGLKGLAIEDL